MPFISRKRKAAILRCRNLKLLKPDPPDSNPTEPYNRTEDSPDCLEWSMSPDKPEAGTQGPRNVKSDSPDSNPKEPDNRTDDSPECLEWPMSPDEPEAGTQGSWNVWFESTDSLRGIDSPNVTGLEDCSECSFDALQEYIIPGPGTMSPILSRSETIDSLDGIPLLNDDSTADGHSSSCTLLRCEPRPIQDAFSSYLDTIDSLDGVLLFNDNFETGPTSSSLGDSTGPACASGPTPSSLGDSTGPACELGLTSASLGDSTGPACESGPTSSSLGDSTGPADLGPLANDDCAGGERIFSRCESGPTSSSLDDSTGPARESGPTSPSLDDSTGQACESGSTSPSLGDSTGPARESGPTSSWLGDSTGPACQSGPTSSSLGYSTGPACESGPTSPSLGDSIGPADVGPLANDECEVDARIFSRCESGPTSSSLGDSTGPARESGPTSPSLGDSTGPACELGPTSSSLGDSTGPACESGPTSSSLGESSSPAEGSFSSLLERAKLEVQLENIYELFKNVYDFTKPSVSAPSSKRKKTYAKNHFDDIEIPGWKVLQGRRIVEYNHFIKWLVLSQAVHSRSCSGILCPLQEDMKSMRSVLWLKCNLCSTIVKGASESPCEIPKLRRSVCWAILSSGSTYATTNEIFSFLDIPFISSKCYFNDEMSMDDILEEAVEASFDKAIQEEVDHAKKEMLAKDNFENSEIELSCEIDGSWAMRSNGHRFNSASGCAAIVGTRTKKIVYMESRNKRCSVCTRNKTRMKSNKEPVEHKCYKNYKGSSGGMESAILVQGFRKLYRKGIKFKTIITDGDSTSVAKIKNGCGYGHEIKHQLCCNHSSKNTAKKLREIKYAKAISDKVLTEIDRIMRDVRSAIQHCADNGSHDIEGLRADIRNVLYHVFQDHRDCRSYYCKQKDQSDKFSIIPELEKHGVWQKMLVLMDKLSAKAEFLSENRTSNLAENIFVRLGKYNVGKRLNLMSRGSWHRRVIITALQCNEGYNWHNQVMKAFTGQNPGSFTRNMFRLKLKRLEHNRKTQRSPTFRRKAASTPKEKDTDYGEAAVEAAENSMASDVDVLEAMKQFDIDEDTKELLNNPLSITQMECFTKGRLLPKQISEIVNCRETTKSKKAQLIVQPTTSWNILKANRPITGLVLRQVKEIYKLNMKESRLFVDSCHKFICCIPDAVSEDGKTILLIRRKDSSGILEEDLKSAKGSLGCRSKDGEMTFDKKTKIEIQTALHVTNAENCLLLVMYGTDVKNGIFTYVPQEENFFTGPLEEKIQQFFNLYILPRILDVN